jgi:hypothetical protein
VSSIPDERARVSLALQCPRVRGQRDHSEAKGSTALTETPTKVQPGFVAQEPEHCHDCYRLIRPGQRYFLTIEQAVLCPDCIRTSDSIRLAGGLSVEVGHDRLLVRRGSDVIEVLAGEVRHLVDALVEGAAGLVDGQ